MSIFRAGEAASTIERRLQDLQKGLQAVEGQRADVQGKLDAAISAGSDTERLFAALALADTNLAARQDVLGRVREELAATQAREEQERVLGQIADFEREVRRRFADLTAARGKLVEGAKALLAQAEKFDALVAGVLSGAPAALAAVTPATGSARGVLVGIGSAPEVEGALPALARIERELAGDLAGFQQRLGVAISAARSAAAE